MIFNFDYIPSYQRILCSLDTVKSTFKTIIFKTPAIDQKDFCFSKSCFYKFLWKFTVKWIVD